MKAKGTKNTGKNAGEIKLRAFKLAAVRLVEATVAQLADLQDSIDLIAGELKRLSDNSR